MSHHQCKKITLAGNELNRVIYCETHGAYELEIGALSLRLDEASFISLCNLLNDAQNLSLAINASKTSFDTFMKEIKKT